MLSGRDAWEDEVKEGESSIFKTAKEIGKKHNINESLSQEKRTKRRGQPKEGTKSIGIWEVKNT